MINLVSAFLSRLWKEKVFWLGMAFMAAFGIVMALNTYSSGMMSGPQGEKLTAGIPLEQYCFGFQWVIGVVAAVVSSLFIGREYQDGTLRNKLIAGHSRTSLYLAGLAVNILSTLLLCLSYLFFACVVGIPLMGGFQVDVPTVLLLILGNLLAVAVYCSLFTWIQLLCSNRAGAVVIALLLTLVLLVAGTAMIGRLQEPEWISYVSYNQQGEMVMEPLQSNPNYLKGPVRTLFQTIVNLLPTGQAFSLAGGGDESLPLLPLYSLGLIALTTGLGIWGFRKKDII